MWSLSEVVTARLCVKGNMSKPAELSTFRDVWSGQSGWRFGREMRLNVRLHNMLCSSVPTVGLARPLENRVQMFYLTEEPKYTLNMVSGWRSCFFSGEANLMGETGMMSAITGDTMIAFGHDGMFGLWMWWDQGSTCRILRKKKKKKKDLQHDSCTWHLRMNGKTCYGEVAISASALEVVQRQHHRDLPFRL